MTKLGVIFGGQSSEYSISLLSASSLLKNIHKDKYELHLIGINQKGESFYYKGSIEDIEKDKWNNPKDSIPCAFVKGGIQLLDNSLQKISLDTVFPVVHGKNAEDGTLQGLLEINNIKCVGCGTLSSAMCMDKEITHILCERNNIPCAKYVCLRNNNVLSFEEVSKHFPLPWIVKPCNAGSSYGVSKVNSKEEYEKAVKEAFKYDGRGKILVEEFVKAREISCGVLGNNELITGAVDEVVTKREFYDFEAKYQLDKTEIHCPAHISKQKQNEVKELAKKVFKTMNCRGFARVDTFMREDESIILNEINTIPGFTSTSHFPTMMKAIGIEYGDLIDKLVELSKEHEVGNI